MRTFTGIPPSAGGLERQYTGSSLSTFPTVSSPESVAASLVSSATSLDSPPLFSKMTLAEGAEEHRHELEGSSPAAELEGHAFMSNSFSTSKEVRMRM